MNHPLVRHLFAIVVAALLWSGFVMWLQHSQNTAQQSLKLQEAAKEQEALVEELQSLVAELRQTSPKVAEVGHTPEAPQAPVPAVDTVVKSTVSAPVQPVPIPIAAVPIVTVVQPSVPIKKLVVKPRPYIQYQPMQRRWRRW